MYVHVCAACMLVLYSIMYGGILYIHHQYGGVASLKKLFPSTRCHSVQLIYLRLQDDAAALVK